MGLLAAAALALIVVLAPPLRNSFWAVNGLRSIPPGMRAGVCATAALAVLLAWRPLPRLVWFALLAAGAVGIAFPMRESIHWLSDTGLRMRLLGLVSTNQIQLLPFGELTWRIHMHPLDAVVDVWAPLALARYGVPARDAVSLVSLVLLLVFAAGIARALADTPVARGLRAPLVAAVLLGGAAELYAGYPESTGLVLAVAVWWWSALITPLRRTRDGVLAALAWLMFFAAHRVALAMLPVQALRHVLVTTPDDEPRARRIAWIADGAAAALAAGYFLLSRGRLSGMDLGQFVVALRDPAGPRLVSFSDVLNLFVLLAPLALLAPALVRREEWTSFVRTPAARLLAVAAVLLLPLLFIFPVAPSGLGAQRDWDLNALLGLWLTLGAGSLLALLPPARLRGALVCALPALALLTGAWVAVNADAGASQSRALAVAMSPRILSAEHRSKLLDQLGYAAADDDDNRSAARYFDLAYAAWGNPSIGIRAAEAWVRAREPDSARADLARLRTRGTLPENMARATSTIERWAALLDSVRQARAAAGDGAR